MNNRTHSAFLAFMNFLCLGVCCFLITLTVQPVALSNRGGGPCGLTSYNLHALLDHFPNRTIHVIDMGMGHFGIGILVYDLIRDFQTLPHLRLLGVDKIRPDRIMYQSLGSISLEATPRRYEHDEVRFEVDFTSMTAEEISFPRGEIIFFLHATVSPMDIVRAIFNFSSDDGVILVHYLSSEVETYGLVNIFNIFQQAFGKKGTVFQFNNLEGPLSVLNDEHNFHFLIFRKWPPPHHSG